MGPVSKGHDHLKIRVYPLEVVIFFQIKVIKYRGIFDHHVIDGVGIMKISGAGYLLCGQTATRLISSFQQKHF